MITAVEEASGLNGALERLGSFFEERSSRQGILARSLLGRPGRGDAELRSRLIREMRAETRIDGSVGGSVVPTIWRAIELMELGHSGDEAGTIRVMGWVLALQELPGGFAEGCTQARHRQKVCEHFIGGFFAPAPPHMRVSPVTLPNGKVFRAEGAARFAVSCLALRAALMAGYERRPGVIRHLESLVLLHEQWQDWKGYFAPDMIVSALGALALAPPPHRTVLDSAAKFVAANQLQDGTWPNADLFHTLEALLLAGTSQARRAVVRAVPGLLAMQRPDGSFGSTAREERALIALRALLEARRVG